jgi:hypothetical protein
LITSKQLRWAEVTSRIICGYFVEVIMRGQR